MATLKEKAMLVTCSVGTWTARKLDKQVSDEIARQKQANLNSGRYNKQLIAAKAPSYVATKQSANAIRNLHYSLTLPWQSAGQILPALNYFDYTQKMGQAIANFEQTLQPFFQEYSQLVQDAQYTLAGLFKNSDYPSLSEVQSKYYARYEIMPLPDAEDFRVNLSNEETEAIRDSLRKRAEAGFKVSMGAAWSRVYTAVSKMAETLSDPDKGFHETLVTNLQDLVDMLPGLNLANDPNMENMRRAIESQLIHSPKDLKKDKSFRAGVAKAASTIQSQIETFSGGIVPEQIEEFSPTDHTPPSATELKEVEAITNKLSAFFS